MFRFWGSGKQKTVEEESLSVVLIGEGYRRAYAKQLLEHQLADRVKVVEELASGKRIELLSELGPEVVILDCASVGIDPLALLSRLAALVGHPRIIALVDGAATLEEQTLLDLGADAVTDIRDPYALANAICPLSLAEDIHRRIHVEL